MNTRRLRTTAAAVLAIALAGLVLAACGSSGGSSTTTASQSASATTQSGAGAGGFAGRFSAFRECMKKQGITLPQRKRGQGGPGGLLGGGQAGGTPTLPAGVSRAQYEAALSKCASLRPRFGAGAGADRFKSPAFTAALTKFSACMRQNGINLPAPNTSGTGPVFNTQGINTTSTQFRAAEAKCASYLRAGFRAGGAAPGAAGGQGPAVGQAG